MTPTLNTCSKYSMRSSTHSPVIKYEEESSDEHQNGDYPAYGLADRLYQDDDTSFASTSTDQRSKQQSIRKRKYSSGSEEQFIRLKTRRSASATEKRLKVEAEQEIKRIQELISRVEKTLKDPKRRIQIPINECKVDEAVKLGKCSSFFANLKPTRRSTARVLPLARVYNSRFQECHLMVAGIDDLDKREPFIDLMQAISDGKFSKSNGTAVFSNSTRVWRQIMKAYNPELTQNLVIIREAKEGGDYEEFIEKLESEGSLIRVWLDNNGRKHLGVREFCKIFDLDHLIYENVYKFLLKLPPNITDEKIVEIAKLRFINSVSPTHTNSISCFLAQPPIDQLDFVYLDMRFFKPSQSQIINWVKQSGIRFIYLRDQNPNYELFGSKSRLNTAYKKRCLATTTLFDDKVPCGSALRTSYLHIMSTRNAINSSNYFLEHQTFDIMLFDELFLHYFVGRSGILFVGGSDVQSYKKFIAESNYHFVFEDKAEQNGHWSDERQDDASTLGW
ncbi:hypothetical protein M3Y97_00436200 [Aphelenchoides bicaudatus]|nr:hypothetical protein M3Y97_00436200 [Aphelenchoides bicaudatus]